MSRNNVFDDFFMFFSLILCFILLYYFMFFTGQFLERHLTTQDMSREVYANRNIIKMFLLHVISVLEILHDLVFMNILHLT